MAWQRHPHTKSKDVQFHHMTLTEQQIKHGVLDDSIPSSSWYTACASHVGLVGDPFIQTNRKSTKIFSLADGYPTPATTITLLEHKIREPVCNVNMIPELANQSLLSGGKFVEAGNVSVCDGEEVNIYDDHTTKITVSEKCFLTGWRCPQTRLWIIPLQAQVTNRNLHTLLLNGPTGQESLNSLYIVPSPASVLEHISLCNPNPDTPSLEEAIHNFYKLPSIE